MFILQNAFRNIMRNRGRNILIGAITLVLIITSVVTLMINNTTSGIIDDYKARFGAEVSLVPNMERMREESTATSTGGAMRMTRPVIPSEQYVEFGESEYLQESLYTAKIGVISEDITAIDAELGGGSSTRMGMGGGESTQPSTEFMMNLLGNKFADFDEGLREIAEGRAPENVNEAIISTDLAELNSLSIGDTISFSSELSNTDSESTERTYEEINYELSVVGTYYDLTDEYVTGAPQNALTNRRNEILTNFETVTEVMQPGLSGIEITATYYLNDPDQLEPFAEEVYAKGLDSVFDVTTDEDSYNKIVGPVEGLKGISITFMSVVLIFGGIIIAILSSIAIRERKFEIGVLRAMGMKKFKVACGLWFEMLIITCLCLVIGLGVGTLVAQPVTNMLLDQQIVAAESSDSPITNGRKGMGAPKGTSSHAQPLDDINIALGLDTIFQIIGIALLLSSLASLISISKITRYEPIKILMERN